MLDYNTLNNLVEVFNKNGISNVKLENGSTLEIKEGQLLINGEPLSIDIGVINTDNITALSTETIEGLKAGDLVLKHTGNQIHSYKVTYKEEHQGICISYYDAGYSETVSYDYVDGVWVYNSTDVVTPIEYSAGEGISIINNTITNTKPNKQLYFYCITLASATRDIVINIISDKDIDDLYGSDANKTILQIFQYFFGNTNFNYTLVNGYVNVSGTWYSIDKMKCNLESNSVAVTGGNPNSASGTTDTAIQSSIIAKTSITKILL